MPSPIADVASTFPVANPALGAPFAQCPITRPVQLDRVLARAQVAFAEWSRDLELRAALLKKCANAIENASDELARLITLEQGKPLAQAKFEATNAAAMIASIAEFRFPECKPVDAGGNQVRILRKPLGVVAAILPWNFPVGLAAFKIGPALLAGNTLVVKPSPYAPLSVLRLGEIIEGVLPAGVVSVVAGDDDLGRALSLHSIPRKVSFTGSVAAGKSVMSDAAGTMKRLTLELGGNDAAIVLADVDVASVASAIFQISFANAGQVCATIKRVYAEKEVHQQLVEALSAIAGKVIVGDGLDPSTEMGPVSTRPQYERVLRLLHSVEEVGGRFASGGKKLERDGYFVAPTIVERVSDGHALVDEEQFGPVLPVVRVEDAEDALRRANRSEYGLMGSVWTSDLDMGANLADRLECGTSLVNAHAIIHPQAPFGGWKSSGFGYESGERGLEEYLAIQTQFAPLQKSHA